MKKIFTLVFIFVISILTATNVHADHKLASYSVTPIFSEHQTDGADSYFDIKWPPASKESFGIKITNNTKKTKQFEIEVNKARTNRNGIVDYSDRTPEKANTVYKLTQMIRLPKEVEVAPNSSQIIHGSISFPAKDFNGILMAGLHFTEKTTAVKKNTVSNTIAYNIPFVIRGNHDQRPTPRLSLDQLKMTKPNLSTYELDAKLTNHHQNLLKSVKTVSTIKNMDNKTLKKETKRIDITPETTFENPIQVPKNIKAGQYKLVLTMQHGKNHWKFEKNFKIKPADLKVAKRHQIQNHSALFIGLAVIALIVIGGGWIIFKKLKRK
ncbi:DUF916 and DUF3324 domain-containing protein [Pediococcus pentosaceus]|uniref:DUF916 and DUF3324 domain-containing protein n=1 Tax=Pediococcus pentosaceus TaxID=1255 RepID=UPI0018A13834|nr:DUF916 and DUF3324 domain-containing protein [Pediococcus pentosaceus]MBF7110426.1 DUF916 and DUF3324 domain-containing protein [Pediococcus pentosaceus]QQA91809.1 DUF916 and DUF3324 domain-containing protein [Pediococcus pentosaceus]